MYGNLIDAYSFLFFKYYNKNQDSFQNTVVRKDLVANHIRLM